MSCDRKTGTPFRSLIERQPWATISRSDHA